ncbi:unnamed protein product [Periconia digitata]|uniref:Thioesterase domain-containing protein n=1 Tax=Periconia digitata TaxID=1303443 RepID=A0A9W4XQ14_9PLEO|nr:unnamed protein product [Periconia digitata]
MSSQCSGVCVYEPDDVHWWTLCQDFQASVYEQPCLSFSGRDSCSTHPLDEVRPSIMNRIRAFSGQHPALRGISRRFAHTKEPVTTNVAPIVRRRLRTEYMWYGFVFASGAGIGLILSHFAAPAPLPPHGSREDQLNMQALTNEVDDLEIVKYMRSQSPALRSRLPESTKDAPEQPTDDSVAESKPKEWVELDFKTNITESKDEGSQSTRTITHQTLAGYKGLGVQRAFWNAETKELVAVVWIGASMSGWPGVAHGGLVATIVQDCMSRMVAGPDASLDTAPLPISLGVTYAKPTLSASFYVVRASFTKPKSPQTEPPPDSEPAPAKSWLPWWKDLTKKEQNDGAQKTVEILGTLENLRGGLLVRAKGTFPAASTKI